MRFERLVGRTVVALVITGALAASVGGLALAQDPGPAGVPMYKGGPGRTGEMPGPAIAGAPVTLWTVALGGPAISSPAVSGGVVYSASGDSHVVAVDAATGAIAWSAPTAAPVRSSPAVADGLVFANDEAGTLYAFNTGDGSVRWSASIGAAPESMPLVMDGTLYIGTSVGDLLALQDGDGSVRWRFATGGELTHSPSSDGERVFIGSSDGTLYAVDRAAGTKDWSFTGGAARWTTAAVRDGLLFTVGHEVDGGDDALFAIDTATGEERWRAPAEVPLYAPSAGPGAVYVADADGVLRAHDAATGSVRWAADIGGFMRPAPAVVEGTLYVYGAADEALGVDAASGRVIWRIALDGPVEYGTTAADGRLYAVTTAGTLRAIGAGDASATGSPDASAPPAAQAQGELIATLEGAPDGLVIPTGLDVDPAGRIWVAEGLGRFSIFDVDGRFVERWGTAGSGDGEFDFDNANSGNPTAAIAFRPDGGFYVADTGNFRIQQFDADRAFVRAWGGFGKGPGQFAIPFDLDVDAQGNVYVTTGNGSVQAFTGDGTYLRTIGSPGPGDGQLANAGLAVSGDRLLVADWDNHRVAVFALDGTFLENWPVRGDPNDIDAAPDGTAYVSASGRIVVLDAGGSILEEIAASTRYPSFVVALDDDRLALTGWQSDPPRAGYAEIRRVVRP